MLCRSCRRQVSRGALFCGRCGEPLAKGVRAPLELLFGETRVPLTHTITLGRAESNDVTLDDPTVSRLHARILVTASDTSIEDAGSSHGTLLDDRPLRGRAPLAEGSVVRLGDTVLQVERHADEFAAGRTVMLDAVGVELSSAGAVRDRAPLVSSRPRLRPGCALKQLEEDEGDRRWVLRDEDGAKYLRMGDAEAALVQVLAAGASLEDLLAASERDQGAAGPARLARLLADLGEHGLLEQTGDGYDPFEHEPGPLERLFKPREWAFSNPDRIFQAAYRWGGWLFFSAPGLVLLTAIAAIGLVAFLRLTLTGHVTPFVVADHLGWGAAVFLAGRLAAVSLHEVGHGLAVASFGRRVRRAGVKLILIFPFAFVDTSDAWFEPRRRRIAVSAAGPATDLIVAGAAAIYTTLAHGTGADIAFQIALGAYIGGLFNLNPLLDRDGYHILVDLLRQPGLRARSRQRLQLRLAGRSVPPDLAPAADLYAVAALGWLLGCACFAILVSTRYYHVLTQLAGNKVIVWALFGIFYAMLFLPIVISVGKPLMMRRSR
jgi:putative peptide zinc metalloprotease protein